MKLIITPILLSSILFSIEGIIVFNDQTIIEGDIKTIENNILEAIKTAHEKSTSTMKDKMNDLTGGLNFNLPGFDNSDS